MRLVVYSDLLYMRDGSRISSSTAFVTWISALAEHVDKLFVLGRVAPTSSQADYLLSGSNITFVPLPYYANLRQLSQVVSLGRASLRLFNDVARDCDAALLFGPHPYATLFGVAANRATIPVVIGVRQDFPEYIARRAPRFTKGLVGQASRLLEWSHQWIARRGGAITVGSEMERRYRNCVPSVLETGISLIRSSDFVPFEAIASRPQTAHRTALIAGRLDPEKNPLLLLDIAELLLPRHRWQLRVAGAGKLAGLLQQEIETRKLGSCIQLLGKLDRDSLREEYLAASTFLHISLTEGRPQVLYEAAAAGTPIVATAVGGVSEALAHGERGLLVPPDSALMVVKALDAYDESAGRIARSQAAWRWAHNDTIDIQTSRVIQFISGVVAESARRRLPSSARNP